ncbi:hypothetical protein D3C84_658760 [compost metagenome]
MNVFTEHRTGVTVFAGHRGAGKGHESGVRQGITQVLGIAHLVTGLALAGLCPLRGFQLGAKAILGSVRFIGDDHDVRALGQHREGVFIHPRHELLDGGEDNAATGPIGQFGAQVTA